MGIYDGKKDRTLSDVFKESPPGDRGIGHVPGTGDAYMIVKDLANYKIPDEEKLKAIERVFNTRSYHFAYKQDLWDIIEYLLERIEKQDADTKA